MPKNVKKKNLRFNVEFIPFEDAPERREHLENSPTIDLNRPDGVKSDMSKGREFSSVAYSGKMIPNHPFWGNLIFDVNNLRAKKVLPILLNHNHEKIVGQGNLRIKNSEIIVDGKILHSSDDGKLVQNFADEGFPWQQSVHIEPAFVEKIPPNTKFTVNQQNIEMDQEVTVFRNSTVKEVSFVALGADSNTSANVFSGDDELISLKEVAMTELVKNEDKAVEETKTEAEPKTEETKTEETKEEPEEKKEDDTKQAAETKQFAIFKFIDGEFVPLESGEKAEQTDEMYKFACDCSTKAKDDDEDETLKAENKRLKEALAKYKKEKRFSLITDLETKLNTKFSDTSKELMESMDDDKVVTFANDLMKSDKEPAKKEVNKKLFKADTTKGSVVEVDKQNPESITEAAKKLQFAAKEKGQKLDFIKAVAQVTGLMDSK